jgi:protein-S-isoprenylcysteine O-methyltransferase Ste14
VEKILKYRPPRIAAFLMGAIQAFFAPAAFFIIMDKVFIPYEEEKLLQGFGNHYDDYMKRTRRWL